MTTLYRDRLSRDSTEIKCQPPHCESAVRVSDWLTLRGRSRRRERRFCRVIPSGKSISAVAFRLYRIRVHVQACTTDSYTTLRSGMPPACVKDPTLPGLRPTMTVRRGGPTRVGGHGRKPGWHTGNAWKGQDNQNDASGYLCGKNQFKSQFPTAQRLGRPRACAEAITESGKLQSLIQWLPLDFFF